ncbi:MAG TPA: hypothetical protein VJP88_08655 [Caulobacteraceae bacterium]|nr:hypothetical protein [Caulobacteraceae bacterium]
MTERQIKAERIAAWEERAGIIEFQGGFARADAEEMATRDLGYRPHPWRGSIVNVIDAGQPQQESGES